MVQLRAGNFGGGRYLALASEQEAEPAVNLPAGSVAGGNAQPQDSSGDSASPDGPAIEAQSASTKAAEGSSAGGTTVSIAVYRSSFPIAKWDLNDDDFGLTEAEWAGRPAADELPQQASPGSEVVWPETGKPADYQEPTRAGFEFAGWSTDKSASAGGYIDGTSPKLTMPEGAPTSDPKAYTLYALWTPNEYSVIFDLSKNPEDGGGPGSDESFALNWESDPGIDRTVIKLGDGRYRVDGFTMDERTYDEATRTVGLPEPARSGYRFLGWSEPDGQNLAIDNAAKTGYAMNPVRLTQIDGTPVLTARWTSAFGVTAPLSITFGDYDKTGAPGNPWLGDAATETKAGEAADDTTQSEADDTTKPEQEGYQALGQAFFENTSWHEAVKLVGLTSARHANANQVLTTYDTSKASEAHVLGDGTEENPGERLLSLYPSASAPTDDKSSGIHFRLTDTVTEAGLGDAFTMAPQGEEGAQKDISYGLNLATDPVDGSANHGLVLPTNDYERKQIATVSYTFATAKAAAEKPVPPFAPTGTKDDALWVENTNPDWGIVGVYGLADIKAAANDFALRAVDLPSDHDESQEERALGRSPYYKLFKNLFDNPAECPFKLWFGKGYVDVQIIGIAQDVRPDGRKAGLTFSFQQLFAAMNKDVFGDFFAGYMSLTEPHNASGWMGCAMREGNMRTMYESKVAAPMRNEETGIVKVVKTSQKPSSGVQQTTDAIWLPSAYELWGPNGSSLYQDEAAAEGAFQYRGFQGGESSDANSRAIRTFSGTANSWWLRSACRTSGNYLSVMDDGGIRDWVMYPYAGTLPCFAL